MKMRIGTFTSDTVFVTFLSAPSTSPYLFLCFSLPLDWKRFEWEGRGGREKVFFLMWLCLLITCATEVHFT